MSGKSGMIGLSLGLLLALLPAEASAQRPLDLTELERMRVWLACTATDNNQLKPADCAQIPTLPEGSYDRIRLEQECAAACGEPARYWEKDGIEPIDSRDLLLADLEYQQTSAPGGGPAPYCYVDPAKLVLRPRPCAPTPASSAPTPVTPRPAPWPRSRA